MSSIGFNNIGAMNIASSAAGAQRTEANANNNKAEAAGRKFQVDGQSMSAQSHDDVAEADMSTERDADGREAFGERRHPEAEGEEAKTPRQTSTAPDAFGDRGGALDLEA
jgi:hypothetical protein